MNVGTRAVGVMILSGALAAAGCGGDPRGAVVHNSASYVEYENVDELWEVADLIIEASVTDEPRVEPIDVRMPGHEADLSAQAAEDASAGDIHTVHRVTVRRVWKGDVREGDTVEVKQLGGVHEGVTYEADESAPLTVGGDYLLFLLTFPEIPGMPASLVNPLQGLYQVDAEVTPQPGNDLVVTRSVLEELAS